MNNWDPGIHLFPCITDVVDVILVFTEEGCEVSPGNESLSHVSIRQVIDGDVENHGFMDLTFEATPIILILKIFDHFKYTGSKSL